LCRSHFRGQLIPKFFGVLCAVCGRQV